MNTLRVSDSGVSVPGFLMSILAVNFSLRRVVFFIH